MTIPAADKFTPDNQTQAQIVKFAHGDPKAAAPVQENLALNPILSTMRKVEVDPGKKGPDGKPATKTVILHEGAIVQNLDNHGTSKPISWVTGKVFIVRTATGKHAKIKVVSHQEPLETTWGNPLRVRLSYRLVSATSIIISSSVTPASAVGRYVSYSSRVGVTELSPNTAPLRCTSFVIDDL